MQHSQTAFGRFVILGNTGLLMLAGLIWLGSCAPVNGPGWREDPERPAAGSAGAEVETREEFDSAGSLARRMEGKTDAEGNFIPHGKMTLFYPNGQKKTELHYINGLRHGARSSWYQSGQPWILGQFVDGREHGTWTVLYEDGRKSQESHYEHGAWHGTFVEWYRNGQKRREVIFANGVKQGTETYWDEDGTVIRQLEYVDGVEQP